MIIKQDPLSLAEVKEMVGEGNEEVEKFAKSFTKMKPETAKKFKEDLEKLAILKLKTEGIVKIIDILPEDASDLNKIFIDTNLDEDEINKILEVVKKYR